MRPFKKLKWNEGHCGGMPKNVKLRQWVVLRNGLPMAKMVFMVIIMATMALSHVTSSAQTIN